MRRDFRGKEPGMFKSQQYRAKAAEYREVVKRSTGSEESRKFQKLQERFSLLADNEQGLADNYDDAVQIAEQDRSRGVALAVEEEHVLRCLGAASSCNGTSYRRCCNGRSSTPPNRSASYWRQRHSAGRSPDFFTSIRMMPVATNSRKSRVAMRGCATRPCRGGTMTEAQSATADRRCE